jgi:hypothetical protein
MTILFVGGEEGDFIKTSSACSVDTATTAARRTTLARCSLKVFSNLSLTDSWSATFPGGGVTSFWLTARCYYNRISAIGNLFAARGLAFTSGGVTRLAVCPGAAVGSNIVSAGLVNQPIALCKITASGTKTTLASSSVNFMGWNTMARFDVQVQNYGATATVTVYLEGVQVLTYTGDVTTDGATSLDGVRLHSFVNSDTTNAEAFHWSEVIAATTDTRSVALATLAPAATGNAFAWSGNVAALNETTLDDTTIASSTSAGQVLETTVTNTTVSATAAVQAVVVSARAMKGATGPTSVNLLVRTGGADYAIGPQALPTGFGRLQGVWATNPATGAAWSASDLTAAGFNIGVQSAA